MLSSMVLEVLGARMESRMTYGELYEWIVAVEQECLVAYACDNDVDELYITWLEELYHHLPSVSPMH